MALTLANLMTDVHEGGLEEGAICTTAQLSAGVITSLTGGAALAIAFPTGLFVGDSADVATKVVSYLMERVWKNQQLNDTGNEVTKKITRRSDGIYTDGAAKYAQYTRYSVEFKVGEDRLNETVVTTLTSLP